MYVSSNYERNYAFDLLKVIGMLVIIIHHSTILGGKLQRGYIFVELFFMISGYFLASSFERNPKMTVLKHIKNRIMKIYPDYIIALCILAIISAIGYKRFPFKSITQMIAEILMIQNWGFSVGGGINLPAWYISVMILSDIMIYIMIKTISSKKVYSFLGMLLVVIIYTFMICIQPYDIENWECVFGVLYVPFLRGFADMLLGTLLYIYKEKYLFFADSKIARVLEIILVLLIVYGLWGNMKSDYVFIALFLVLIICISSNKSFFNIAGKNRLCRWVAKYEYVMYLNHWCILLIYFKIASKMNIQNIIIHILLVYTLVLLGSVTIKKFTEYISWKITKR